MGHEPMTPAQQVESFRDRLDRYHDAEIDRRDPDDRYRHARLLELRNAIRAAGSRYMATLDDLAERMQRRAATLRAYRTESGLREWAERAKVLAKVIDRIRKGRTAEERKAMARERYARKGGAE